MSSEIDYLIVGQGLAGSVLSYQLMREGKKVLVADSFHPNSSSQVAAGLVNPVTGRRIVKSWMADILIPFAKSFYKHIENEFDKSFYHSMDVLEVVRTIKDQNEWLSRMGDEEIKKYFISELNENIYVDKISTYQKLVRITSSAWMDIPLFTELIRMKLKASSSLIEESFDHPKLIIENNLIRYKNIVAENIIYCEGYKSYSNPLWEWLPFLPAKGEILLIECKNLPEEYILLSGIFIIPIGNQKFRIGSTYEWNFKNEEPSEEGKTKILIQLKNLIKIPFTVIDHRAGIRPTVKDRRPLIGKHPDYKNVFIFNGMGTKGVQLAPYFGRQFVDYLLNDKALLPETDIRRFIPGLKDS